MQDELKGNWQKSVVYIKEKKLHGLETNGHWCH